MSPKAESIQFTISSKYNASISVIGQATIGLTATFF